MPLKIKIFVWQLLRDRLPSGTKVLKRHGPGNGLCPLCLVPETGTHILFSCVAAQHFGALFVRLWDRSGRPMTLQSFYR
uniref:Reverse transcriptase zinc-binding domain-containing protein n=1 Tax=Aegilops tauschii subsp. strangulata TaxID=200361 RepID=A0A453ND24_AEGTS